VEQLWSRAVAAQRSPPQTLTTRSRRKQAETVALGFAPPYEHLDGKEGVDGSSPSGPFSRFERSLVALADPFGLVRIGRLVGGSRARPVDVNGDAGRVCGRFNDLEMQRGVQILEQGEPGAECGWLDHQSVLVDQPQP
jgi:hypothetical protein